MTLRDLLAGQTAAVAGGRPDAAAPSPEPSRPAQSPYAARAELVLARDPTIPLRGVPLKPDPLQSLAAATYDIRPDLGEHAEVCVDLLPLTPARIAHQRRRALRRHDSDGVQAPRGAALGRAAAAAAEGLSGLLAELLDEVLPGPGQAHRQPSQAAAAPGVAPRPAAGDVLGKLATISPMFAAQILLRVESEVPGRAEAHLHQLLAAFDVWSGENWWRSHGWNLGFRHIGADTWFRRRRFDRRVRTAEFRPAGENIVSAGEIAGLLKPPTRHCAHHNVARSGGMVPPPPRDLPTYNGQPDIVPLGYAPGPDGREKLLGMPLADLFFSLRIGKSRYGKTETALVQAMALTLGGHGVWFLDPHADGWRRIRPLLTQPQVLERLWEIDLTVRGGDATIAGYNPLAMAGLTQEHVEDRVDAVVTSIASALSWGDSAPRAKTILTKACETLCHLALQLPPEAAPTLFQIRTLLDDEQWREHVLGVLPPALRRYWTRTYPKYPAEATPTITNVIERLAASQTLSAFFGSSQSTYDVRRAMDTGRVVFLCPPGGDIGRLVSCFLIYDLFRAGRSRVDLPAEHRRRFDAFVDELTTVDGAAKGHLAGILEQLGKYGVRLHAMTQMAQRLTAATRDALLQNQSLLSSTAGDIDAVRMITKQWAKHVEPQTLVDLPRFHHVLAATVAGQSTPPFKVRGAVVTELFAGHDQPERLPAQAAAIDRNLGRRPIREVLAELDTLDDRILHALGRPPTPPSQAALPRGHHRGDGTAAELPEAAGLREQNGDGWTHEVS